jgi:hypothetical protein
VDKAQSTARTQVRRIVHSVPDEEHTEADRAWLVQADHAAHRDFDRVVTTLSSGALAISLVFVHDVAPKPEYNAFLIVAWTAFALSLLVNLFSYLTSIEGLRGDIDRIDGRHVTTWLAKRPKFTGTLNWWSFYLFLIGVASLVVFAAVNVRPKG